MLVKIETPKGSQLLEHDAPSRCHQPIAVTTARRRKDKLQARAQTIAKILGVPCLERTGLGPLSEIHGYEWFYVVGHRREEVVSARGNAFFVQPGMYRSKIAAGLQHPLLQACSPQGSAHTLLDCTLGLAHDALHLAGALSLRVLGIEKSPVLQCLLEEGLLRLARESAPWGEAARRIELHRGDAFALLFQSPAQSYDVVYFDPMMPYRLRATPAFARMREANLGAPDQPNADVLARAQEVACQRVVFKQPKGAPLPPMRVDRLVQGAHVQYAICETG